MEIVGRVTQNAVVKQLKDERQVVNFTVAINDYFKPKVQAKESKRHFSSIAHIGSVLKLQTESRKEH